MSRSVPPLTLQFPPLSIASETFAVMSSQSLGLDTVIVPLVVQRLSVPAVWVTFTVYVNVAEPPWAMWSCVLSASFAIVLPNVRVNAVSAVLATVRSAPTQTVTVFFAVSVVPVVLVVEVAVLSCVVHSPAGSSLKVCEYLNSVGLASVENTVPRLPPFGAFGSATVRLPSTVVVGSPKAKAFVAVVVPAWSSRPAVICCSHEIVALFVPFVAAVSEQVYVRSDVPFAGTVAAPSCWTAQAVLPIASVTPTVTAPEFGLLIVIVPPTAQPLSVPLSCVTLTV